MTVTEEFEAAIAAKLKGDITDVEVDVVPDNVSSYVLKHPVGALLVQYARSSYTAPRALNSISQTRSMRFSVFVMMRSLRRDDKGAYAKIDQTLGILTGFQPRGARKMYPLSDRFVSEQSGIWIYEMVFELETIHEEVFE